MKVAIVTAFPKDTSSPRGGVEVVSVNLVAALAALDDLDLHVVTTAAEAPAPATESWNGVTVHRLPVKHRRVLVDAIGPGRRQMRQYLSALQPDVVHAHDVYGLMVKGLAVPTIQTIHGFIHGDTVVSGEPLARVRGLVWRRVETGAWARQHHIISISPYVRERLTPIASGVIHDVENPIAPLFFDVPRRESGQTVFSAAVVSPRKNTLALVDAVAQVAAAGVDVTLRLAGPVVDEAYAARVRARIDEHGLGPRTTWLGSIGPDEVRRELASASLFALVSLEENAPLAIEEAMAVGVPVVTSNRCGMPYMVRHAETGYLVDPLNPSDIAARIAQLLRDGDGRRRMGAAAKRAAQERFHPAAIARRTRDIYREAVAGARRLTAGERH
ncbi:MAG TPA: glycosyltransferase family 4 protein [Vicinamibacterales bacterium]|nr:glycosyltransferase family 4 protein [Vicinamibacterales bacterium]